MGDFSKPTGYEKILRFGVIFENPSKMYKNRLGRTEYLLPILKRIWIQICRKSVTIMLRRCAPASVKLRDPIDNPFIDDLLVYLLAENSYNWHDFNWFWVLFSHTADLDHNKKTEKMLRRCAPASSKLRQRNENPLIGDLLLSMFAENRRNWKHLGDCGHQFSEMSRTMYLWDYVDKHRFDCFLPDGWGRISVSIVSNEALEAANITLACGLVDPFVSRANPRDQSQIEWQIERSNGQFCVSSANPGFGPF